MDKKTNLIGYPIVIILTAILAFLIGKYMGTKSQELYPANGTPKEIININQVGNLYNRYQIRADQIDSIESSIPDFEAARAITFEYQEIKNYLAYIEKNSVEANIRISGLRVYFGKYPNDTLQRKRARQMLFFNPTIDTVINGKKTKLAYALDRTDTTVGIKFLKDLVSQPQTRGKNHQNVQQNEASALSFLNFSSQSQGQIQSQSEQGGQISPPPSGDGMQ